MSNQRAWMIGCGAALGVAFLVAAAIVGWIAWVTVNPSGVSVAVEAPASVTVGEDMTLTVIVTNERPKRRFGLTTIDIADEYLAGFVILGSEPAAKSNAHIPLDNTRSFSFERPLAPGETARFQFTLRPRVAGFYSGDVDVCEGQRFLSAGVQTEVVRPTGRRPAAGGGEPAPPGTP